MMEEVSGEVVIAHHLVLVKVKMAAFQITYFFFYLLVHTAAGLTHYLLLHAVQYIQLGHATSS